MKKQTEKLSVRQKSLYMKKIISYNGGDFTIHNSFWNAMRISNQKKEKI